MSFQPWLPDHPVMLEIYHRYQVARGAWNAHPGLREAAGTLNMTEREYCDRFIELNFGVLVWTSSSNDFGELTREHFNAAYEAAGRKKWRSE